MGKTHLKNIIINEDKIMFSDDTGVAFKELNDIKNKLEIYDKVTKRNQLLVNWEKSLFLAQITIRPYKI